jgi:hypothetical protein
MPILHRFLMQTRFVSGYGPFDFAQGRLQPYRQRLNHDQALAAGEISAPKGDQDLTFSAGLKPLP